MLCLNMSFDDSLETPACLAHRLGGGKVKPGAQGGAPVGQHLVLFQDLSGKPDYSLQKPHILVELQHRERIGKGHIVSRGLAGALKAIFSCRSFVSDIGPASKGVSAKSRSLLGSR